MVIDWEGPKFTTAIVILVTLIISFLLGQIIIGYSHKITLALITGAIIFLTTLVNTDAALAILIFSMLLSPEILLGRVPGREIVIRFDDILLALITFTWLAKTAINKGLALFIKTPLNKAILAYISICIVATLRGTILGYIIPGKGFFYVTRYAEYFLLYILVANNVHSRKQINFFLKAIFITCAIVSILGILQIPSGERVSAPFEGESGEPNTFGGYLLFILCLAIGILLQKVSPNLTLVLGGLGFLIFLPFLFTLSRASYVGIVFSFLAFIFFSKRKVGLITATAAIILVVILLRPEAVFSRIKYTFQQREAHAEKIGGVYLDSSASARIQSWRLSFKKWEENPILGRGVTGYPFVDGEYMRTLPEVGIVGLLALLWLFWEIYRNSLRIYKQMDDELYKGLSIGFVAGFIGLTAHALTANTFIIIRIMEPFWFMAGIIMMLPMLKEELSESSATNTKKTVSSRFAV
jgi:O-antigen ligase